MLEKNQKITTSTQQGWIQEKFELESNHKTLEQGFKRQIENYREEVKLLKLEIDRLRSNKGSQKEGDLRIQLMREIERLELAQEDREADLIEEINKLKLEIRNLIHKNESKEKEFKEERHRLSIESQNSQKDVKRTDFDLKRNFDDLALRYRKVNEQLENKNEEVERLKNDYEDRLRNLLRQKNEGEDIWKKERKSFVSGTSRVEEIMQEKQKILELEINDLKYNRNSSIRVFNQQIEALQSQNRKLERQVQDLTFVLENKDAKKETEIDRLRNANVKMIENGQKKENLLESQLDSLRNEMQKLLTEYEARENVFLNEVNERSHDLQKCHDIIINQERLLEGGEIVSVNFALRSEVKSLYEQLKTKNEQINSLRDLYISSKHSERRSITKAISSAQTLLEDITKQQTSFLKTELDYKSELQKIEEKAVESEKKHLQEIADLSEELISVRNELVEFTNKKLDKEILNLQEQLMNSQEELEHAKKNILNYLVSIKSLEEIIQSKMTDESFDQTDQIKLINLEIGRLNAENQSLVDSRNKLEDFHLQEIRKLHLQLDKKSHELEQAYSRLDRLKGIKANKDNESLKALEIMQQAQQKLLQNMKKQLKNLNAETIALRKLKDISNSLQSDELKLLRAEVNEKEDWVHNMREAADKEKSDLENELSRLRGLFDSISQSQEKRAERIEDEYALIITERKRLQELNLKLKHQLENDSSKSAAISFGEKQKILENSYHEGIEIVKEEAESLKHQLDIERITHKKEIEIIKSTLGEDVNTLRQIEDAMSSHLSLQQDQIANLNQVVQTQKEIHLKEMSQYQAEIKILQEATKEKVENLKNEKRQLNQELNRLASLANKKEDDSKRLLNDKLSRLETSVDEKHKLISEFKKQQNQPLEWSNENENRKEHDTDLSQLKDEIKGLVNLIQERERSKSQEKDSLNAIIGRLQASLEAVNNAGLRETDALEKEILILNKKVELASNDREIIRKQRDEALEILAKSKKLDKINKNDIDMLVVNLRGNEQTRVNKLRQENKKLTSSTSSISSRKSTKTGTF